LSPAPSSHSFGGVGIVNWNFPSSSRARPV
jgi:hypothetical protein